MSNVANTLSGTLIVHTIEVRRAVTRQPIMPLRARLKEQDGSLWQIKQKANWVILSTDRANLRRLPEQSIVTLQAPHADQQAVLDNCGQMDVVLGKPTPVDGRVVASKIEVDWLPAPMTLQLELVQTTNQPISGLQTVSAVAVGDKNSRHLSEDENIAGLYRSETLVWGVEYARFSIQVNGKTVAKKSMDYSRPVTRLRQIHDLELDT